MDQPPDVAVSSIEASSHFDADFCARAVRQFGSNGAWLLLSHLWYGWRVYYDLACRLVTGSPPGDSADRPVPLQDEHRIAVDLQVQAYVYSAAEQFATLLRAMRRHKPGTDAFFEAYVGAPTKLHTLIGDVATLERAELAALVGDPSKAVRPAGLGLSWIRNPHDVPTVGIGGIEVPRQVLDVAAFDSLVKRADELLDAILRNAQQLRQLVDPPPPFVGADVVTQGLRAVDNSFRHGFRVLFHRAAPERRSFSWPRRCCPPRTPTLTSSCPGEVPMQLGRSTSGPSRAQRRA